MTLPRAFLLLLLILATPALSAATDPTAWQASQADAVRSAQAALPRQAGLNEAQRKDAADLLTAALADEEQADQQVETWRNLRAQAQRASDDLAPLELRLGEDDGAALKTWRATLPQRAPVEQLETLLETARTALVDARNAVAAQQGELAALFDRPATLRDELKEAQNALDLLPASPSATAPNTPAALAPAQRLRQAAALRRAQTRVASLEEELGSYEARLRYASARLRERQHDAAMQQQKVERLQTLVLDRTSAAVAELNARLQREAAAQEKSPRLLADAAAGNVALGEELARAVAHLGEVRLLRDADAVARHDTEQALQNTNERLKVGGASAEAVGLILLAERRKLKALPQLRRELAQRQTELAQARMRLIDLREMATALEDPPALVQSELRRHAEGADAQAATLQPALLRLLDTRAEFLPRLIVAQTRLTEALGDAEQALRARTEATATLRDKLDERLLWTPSHTPVDLHWFADIGAGAVEFLRPTRWWESLKRVAQTAAARPLLCAACLLAAIALLLLRRRVPAALDAIAVPMRRIRTDRYRFSGQALWLTLLASLPLPVSLWLLAHLWLHAAEPGYAFSDAIGTTLASLVAPAAALAFARWLDADKGLAVMHFRWAQARRSALEALRRGFSLVLLPAQFIIGVLFWSGDAVFADDRLNAGLGRAVFVLAAGVFAWLAWRALAPGALWAQRVATREPIRLRQLLRVAVVAFALGLVALALAGYYLTAVSLAAHLVESLIALLLIAVLHGMAMRWLVLGERRLALKRAEERRGEEPAREDDDLEARPDLSAEEGAITLASVNMQTRRLLRAVTALLLGVVLLWLWAEVAPALSYLGHLHAWSTSYQLDGKEQLYEVNLRQLLFAAVALMLTWIGTRNLPGLLEIGVLRRLDVDAPTRYAITALCRYAIVIVGTLFGLSLLGLRWSQLQWMAAGLTVGLGFGLQEIFANFVSGLIVLFERPMRVGDIITIGGIEGTVARIRTRATTVVDWDNKEVVIPNKTFITDKLTNWTLSDDVTRLVIKLGVGYDSDPDAVRTLLLEVARAQPKVLREPPPNCWCVALGASTLDFELRVFVAEVLERNAVRNDLHAAILRECRKRGIEIAFPQTDVWLRNLPEAWRAAQAAPSADITSTSKRD